MYIDHPVTELKDIERLYRRRNSLPADESAALHFRAHLFKYLSGMKGWSKIRRNLNNINTLAAVKEAVDTVLP